VNRWSNPGFRWNKQDHPKILHMKQIHQLFYLAITLWDCQPGQSGLTYTVQQFKDDYPHVWLDASIFHKRSVLDCITMLAGQTDDADFLLF
jgi:hypothetical protein